MLLLLSSLLLLLLLPLSFWLATLLLLLLRLSERRPLPLRDRLLSPVTLPFVPSSLVLVSVGCSGTVALTTTGPSMAFVSVVSSSPES